ncbi:MAG: hypothetical protein Q616_SPPC00369G0001, partial [Streptococcus parasanguinis DORA_23_24]
PSSLSETPFGMNSLKSPLKFLFVSRS